MTVAVYMGIYVLIFLILFVVILYKVPADFKLKVAYRLPPLDGRWHRWTMKGISLVLIWLWPVWSVTLLLAILSALLANIPST